MGSYAVRLYNADGSSDRFELGAFAEDAAATHAARSALLVSLTGRRAELWRGDLLVACFDRDVAQFRRREEPPRAMRPA
jgi:hypothetical protein